MLAFDRFDQDELIDDVLDKINLTFYAIFVVEMLIKWGGYGFKFYFKSTFNVFDCLIVIISTVDVVIIYTSFGSGKSRAFQAIRAFRLLRVFKLVKSWK